MARQIEVIARGLLAVDGSVLLCRAKVAGYHYLPGGHVEFGESAIDALRREFLEETGVRVLPENLIAVSEASFRQRGKPRHEINLVFHVKLEGRSSKGRPEIRSLEPKIAFDWVKKSDLRRCDVRPHAARELLANWSSRGERRCSFGSDFAE